VKDGYVIGYPEFQVTEFYSLKILGVKDLNLVPLWKAIILQLHGEGRLLQIAYRNFLVPNKE
jgi:hypothetical protein